ncbi:hypothetical protein IW261DRAFT_1104295 [Armillaria novae-zelandiae]|uniref:Uncharacterized protein n=1 Tax=Armillaria novae-zelandiae TaxID=153914 RepID=A0AA39PCS3_9AGAR|nr:hypothetical protein IW261DRAFT_1104295 [Armillaria novae-zelandiae]
MEPMIRISYKRFNFRPTFLSLHTIGLAAFPSPFAMLSSKPSGIDVDPFILYSRSLRDYTLHLWTESRRVVEEEAQRADMLREAEVQSAKACKGVSTHSQSSPLFSPSSTTSVTLKDKEKK